MSVAARTLRHVIPRSVPAPTPPTRPPSLSRPPNRASLLRDIEHQASLNGTPLTLSELYDVGQRARTSPSVTRIHSAQWVHNELPIRLAHRARELSQLPHGLALMPSVISVRDMYESSFHQLRQTAMPRDEHDEQQFSNLLTEMRQRHDSVVKLIAKGVIELKQHCGKGASDLEIRSFLDRFYMSRIGIRVLISHHLALGPYSKDHSNNKNMAGIINTKCKPPSVIQDVVGVVQQLSYQHYGDAAEVKIKGNTDLEFPYIESHMQLCLLELLKNSFRATVETHRDSPSLPPVRVIIADGVEDVTIKISDEGGGFRRSELDRVWSYLFTTAKLPAEELLRIEDDRRLQSSNRPDPIAGFGYGLPLSRLYARYWGGELALTSMEGIGTDAYLHLSKLGDKKECLGA